MKEIKIDSSISKERQKFQMTKKGLEDIAIAVKDSGEKQSKAKLDIVFDGVEVASIKGQKGDKGDKGEQGIQGVKGDKGDSIKGEKGIQGIKGEKGSDGKNGSQGIKGNDGKDGSNGKDGTNGKDGSPDSSDTIISKLQSVKKDWLDINAIKGDFNTRVSRVAGGSATSLKQLTDVDYSGLTQDAQGNFILGSGGGSGMVYPSSGIPISTGSAWGTSITGTSSQFVKADGSLDSSTYLTTYAETDPVFVASQAHNITAGNITVLGNTSNTNTGDETTATIKTKLSITTLSGSNTGDQTTITGNAGTVTSLAGHSNTELSNGAGYTTNTGDVTLTGIQTLTNKTLTAPKISTISNTGTLTLPTTTGTLALTSQITGTNSGTNTGDNAANTTYASDYRAANFVAGTNYQAPLVSGTSIKTINSTSLLGSGDIAISSTDATKLPLAGGTMTGALVLATGSTTLAPIKMVAGTNLTTPQVGTLEFDGTNLYFSI